MRRFYFPAWLDKLVPFSLMGFVVLGTYALVVGAYGISPRTINVGYAPTQPVPFSHKLHAGQLKMDCRYCHGSVDQAAHAAVPPTATCANCHSAANPDGSVSTTAIHTNSPKLLAVRQSQATGEPIEWQKVHDLADHAHFDHSAHVARGVACVSCHGRVDRMEKVYQAEPLSMSWCLDCHRNPEPHLRPREHVTNMEWLPDEPPEVIGARLRKEWKINPSTNCSTCHR
jgi:menaquinone reductase, multiheme cytochrome c subunit